MRIEAAGLRKRFGARWIVHDFTHAFAAGSRTAIAGPNGSGKSTLLRLLSGQLLPSEGGLRFVGASGTPIPDDRLYRHVSLCGPYLELIEELTGEESVALHRRLRGFRGGITAADLWARVGWAKRIRRQRIGSYSSGMMQRLRLLLALATEADLLLLDEPTSNLDAEGVGWYRALVDEWAAGRTVVIASNEERDFVACRERVEAEAWRPPVRGAAVRPT